MSSILTASTVTIESLCVKNIKYEVIKVDSKVLSVIRLTERVEPKIEYFRLKYNTAFLVQGYEKPKRCHPKDQL